MLASCSSFSCPHLPLLTACHFCPAFPCFPVLSVVPGYAAAQFFRQQMDPEMVGNVHPVWDPREGRVQTSVRGLRDICVGCSDTSTLHGASRL